MTDYFKYQKIIKCQDTGEECVGYVAYLNSKHWLRLRKYILSIKNMCEICSEKSTNLQLHHKTYKNLGNENIDDFLLLCNDCHKLVHKNNISVNIKIKYKKHHKINKKKLCCNCKSFSKIKYNNKKVPYCQYYGKLNPKVVCKKYKEKK